MKVLLKNLFCKTFFLNCEVAPSLKSNVEDSKWQRYKKTQKNSEVEFGAVKDIELG